ncbi:succinate dehydrogenase [Anopheles sinensis]|uniref:Succinate dehydrogenase n=1 Tax=Anopheles sinensis TaxID=74873 RepID=A0A084WL75_ANOSI|nr:succinate dehydrogenase [Anopheles sinensis]
MHRVDQGHKEQSAHLGKGVFTRSHSYSAQATCTAPVPNIAWLQNDVLQGGEMLVQSDKATPTVPSQNGVNAPEW